MDNNQKTYNVAEIFIITLLIIVSIILIKIFIPGNNIETTVLTSDNFQEIMEKYSKSKGGTDDIVYVGYAIMYYSTVDYISNALLNGFSLDANSDVELTNIYGKTIKELKADGKSLMKKNNLTPKQFLNAMQTNPFSTST